MHVRTADTDRSGGQDGAFKTICDSTTAGGGSVVTSATQERDPSALLSVGNSIVHLRLPPFQSLIDRKPLRQMCLRRVLFSNILCGRVDLTTDFFLSDLQLHQSKVQITTSYYVSIVPMNYLFLPLLFGNSLSTVSAVRTFTATTMGHRGVGMSTGFVTGTDVIKHLNWGMESVRI